MFDFLTNRGIYVWDDDPVLFGTATVDVTLSHKIDAFSVYVAGGERHGSYVAGGSPAGTYVAGAERGKVGG